MKRTLLVVIVTGLAIGFVGGCKSESDQAQNPQQRSVASPSQETQSPWSLVPAASDRVSDRAETWPESVYSPAAPGAASPESPRAEAAFAAPEMPAPPSQAPAAPSADVPGTAAELPYDPALDAPGYGRPRQSFSARSVDRNAPAPGNGLNPLRSQFQEGSEPNPLRADAMGQVERFSASPSGSSLSEPAGGSAPPTTLTITDQPSAEPPSTSPPGENTAVRSFAPGGLAHPAASARSDRDEAQSDASPLADAREDDAQAADMARMAMGQPPQSVPATEASSASAKAPAVPAQPFDTVRVFYGTDRLSWQPNAETWGGLAIRYWPTLAAAFATALFGFIAFMWRHWLSAGMAIGSLLTAGLVGYVATTQTLEQVRIAEKAGVRYLAERSVGGEVELGICEVTIPKTHAPGQLEAPSILRLEVREDETKHVILQKTERLEDDEFYEELRERVASSPGEELFVFVHGFNVSFENAARRTAQMAHDLKYEGAPIFYSWPASDKFLLTYAQDETNVSWAAPHLKKFLLDVARNSQAKSINVIAHSMGNRALTSALRELELEFRDDARLFNQVVLAAPDIDAEDFRQNIAPFIQKTSRRITLYASSNDQALAASQLVHRYPRAGDSGQVLVVVPGIETVDVSAIDGGPWGHSYYGSSDPILKDLAVLFRGGDTIARSWLAAQDINGLNYWVFQAQAASARTATEPETLR